VLFGGREAASYDYATETVQPAGASCAGCVPYQRFRGEDSPLPDLLHAAGQLLADPDSDAILASLARTSRACVLQEASSSLGAAGQVLSLIAREGFELLDAAPVLIAAPIAPVPFAPELEDAYMPSLERVVAELRRLGGY